MLEKIKELKEELIPKCAMIFDFNGVISTPQEFTNVLIRCCEKEHKDLVILQESMTPIVKIDGKVYIVRIDRFFGKFAGGAKIDTPYQLPYFGGKSGQRLYVYPYEYRV